MTRSNSHYKFDDNQSWLKLIKEEKMTNRAKHIDTKYYFVNLYVNKKLVSGQCCQYNDIVADMLTKALPASRKMWSVCK